jgi:predicted DNA binding protein
LTLPAFDFDVTSIEVVGAEKASAAVIQNFYVGENAISTQTVGAQGTNKYEIAADYQAAGNQYTLKVESAHNTQITKIVIYKAVAETE